MTSTVLFRPASSNVASTVAPEIYGEPLRGTLKQSWKLRVGDWRIGYIIVKKIVKIIIIGHRSRIYEEFERRIK